jgi:hypothetical protein
MPAESHRHDEPAGMDLISQVTLMGGVTDRASIVRLRGAGAVDRALRAGMLLRDARGRYALPAARQGIRTASSIAGVLSHRSAAHYWGWAQKKPDGLPEVTVPRNRRVDPALRRLLIPHWADLPSEDVVKGCVTSPLRTLVDCMRNLPWDEALAIVDSALRVEDITKEELLALAVSTRGRGRTRIIAVADSATAKSASVLESLVRAFAELVPGLDVESQVSVQVDDTLTLHPDLADPGQDLIVEAEGFEWHGKAAQLTLDCRRYNAFVLLGCSVIRLSWVLVMFDPAYVQSLLVKAVALLRRPDQHANVAWGT